MEFGAGFRRRWLLEAEGMVVVAAEFELGKKTICFYLIFDPKRVYFSSFSKFSTEHCEKTQIPLEPSHLTEKLTESSKLHAQNKGHQM